MTNEMLLQVYFAPNTVANIGVVDASNTFSTISDAAYKHDMNYSTAFEFEGNVYFAGRASFTLGKVDIRSGTFTSLSFSISKYGGVNSYTPSFYDAVAYSNKVGC